VYSGQEPIGQDVFKCLENRPSILKARAISKRILLKMKKFIAIFVIGMTA
jgi:type I restriction enzyme, R subunit